ncbi:hypothetical protein RvY_02708 [Ramazzottius varieornatus]|uniref:RING-type domain-containing protein n=1 Tax=Ramazzottius varieornatus TaxID=947166 RepID=A0A1D1UP30_RAMVA|nr:hypothetical protein RvY_02708 [Ramazzottius varieornatus]
MSHYCRDCDRTFEELNPDGTCPDCYEKDGIESRQAKPPEVATNAAEAALPTIRAPVSIAAHPLHALAITPLPQLPALDSLQFPTLPSLPALDGPDKLHYLTHGNLVVPKLPSLDFTASQAQEYGITPPLSPYHSYNDGRALSNGHAVHSRSQQLVRQPFPKSTRGRGGTQSSVHTQQNGNRRGKFPDYNGIENVVAVEQLSTTVDQATDKVMGRLDGCTDPNILVEQAPILQSIFEKLQKVKEKFESRAKDILGDVVSVEQLTYGLDAPAAASAAESSKKQELKPRRQRKKAVSNSVIVKNLPPDITEADLRRHFEQFCDRPSDVSLVKVVMDVTRRLCKGYAYVVLQHENIVKKILAQKAHTIKRILVSVSEHDEEEQLRRKRAYKIFVGGLSSFMSEETLEDSLEETYGELEGLWFHVHKENPWIDNAYAYINFATAETNDRILEEGTILINGRKFHCKKFAQQKNYLDEKKREGRFGPNWRERERANSGPEAPTTRGASPPPPAKVDGPAPLVEPSKPRGRDEGVCAVCVDEPSCIFLIPCGHVGTCARCAELVNDCPTCRRPIAQRLRAYLV